MQHHSGSPTQAPTMEYCLKASPTTAWTWPTSSPQWSTRGSSSLRLPLVSPSSRWSTRRLRTSHWPFWRASWKLCLWSRLLPGSCGPSLCVCLVTERSALARPLMWLKWPNPTPISKVNSSSSCSSSWLSCPSHSLSLPTADACEKHQKLISEPQFFLNILRSLQLLTHTMFISSHEKLKSFLLLSL